MIKVKLKCWILEKQITTDKFDDFLAQFSSYHFSLPKIFLLINKGFFK